MTSFTPAIEMYLNGAWVDVIADWRHVGSIHATYGITGAGVNNRVASPGNMQFALDNSAYNSAGKIGYYSPNHANCRTGFALGTLVRFRLTNATPNYLVTNDGDYLVTNDGDYLVEYQTYFPFYGQIKKVTPIMGLLGARYVDVSVSDYMEQLSLHKTDGMAVQLNQRGDQLLTTLIANIPSAPLNTSYSTGSDTYQYAFHDLKDENTFALTVAQKIAQSGFSLIYRKGDYTNGETLKFEDRLDRLTNITPVATINNEMKNLVIEYSADNIWNTVKSTAYPARIDTSAVVMAVNQRELTIGAGASTTFTLSYRDPVSQSTRIALSPGTQVTPVADTDYKMSSVSGNNGNDLNANLIVSVTWGGNQADITLTNNHGSSTGYVNLFQLRGFGIYLYDPAESTATDAASIALYGDRSLRFNMPYQSNINVTNSLATTLLARYKNPMAIISSVTFLANRSDALLQAALTCDVGTRVAILETVTGIMADYFINLVDLTIKAGYIMDVTWLLEPASLGQFFKLDDATTAILDNYTCALI